MLTRLERPLVDGSWLCSILDLQLTSTEYHGTEREGQRSFLRFGPQGLGRIGKGTANRPRVD